MACTTTCVQPSPTNAHCSACHVTFGSVTGFDRHRRGGECYGPALLSMHRDRRGVWRMAAPDPTARRIWPQRAENGSGVPESTPQPSEDDYGDYPPLQETYFGSGIYE